MKEEKFCNKKMTNNHFNKNLFISYIVFSLVVFITLFYIYIFNAKDLTLFLAVAFGIYSLVFLLVMCLCIYFYIQEQKKISELYKRAYMDPITNLGNEIYFKENSMKFLKSKSANKYVAVFDINKFKMLYKMYDENVGNKILKEVGNKVETYFSNKSIICRITRDFFGIAFSYKGDISKLINKVCDDISTIKVENIDIKISLCWGIYKVEKAEQDINKIMDKAYMAHAEAKKHYLENYYLFDKSLDDKMNEEQEIELKMEDALINNEFKVFYQPKISVKKESLAGAEALVRWKKDGKELGPNKFIPLFEKNKFIIKLDLYVFDIVCKNMADWILKYGTTPMISVNVSKEHFVNEYFIDEYVNIAKKYNINTRNIEIEITESATVDENIDIIKIVKYIKSKGFIVSLDDFGTGYTSLSMLQDLPIDIIKIDKTFIDKVDFKSKKNIINHIINIAKSLEKTTVVEGVEKEEQVEFIKKQRCDLIQGYYFSKPLSKEKFEKYFQNN